MLLDTPDTALPTPQNEGRGMTEEIRPDPRFIDRRLLRSVCDAIGEFRNLSATMPVGEVYMFLMVCLNEGLSLSELAVKADMKISTASRYLLDLSDKQRAGKPGFGLVVREQDPSELRRNMYALSPKGRNIIKQLMANRQV